MRVIPVLDVKGGKAVHAKAGSRDEYMPLRSVVCEGCDPVDVAEGFMRAGFSELYLADLDGIMRHKPDLKLIGEIASKTGLKVMADIGLMRAPDAEAYDFSPILSSESLTQLGSVPNPQDYVFSIDTRGGALISASGLSLSQLVGWLRSVPFKDCILLDLAVVGTDRGPNVEMAGKVSKGLGRGVIYGCGTRGIEDIIMLRGAGASGVLVGSAIHSGALKACDLLSL
jgi:phosphoribosylformimino-5-aminoimidazole carboxamide ribotide isomerase